MRVLPISLLLASFVGAPAIAVAADVPLTTLDVCDALGLTGLTISSDTNCLQLSGGVYYEFFWGDYETALDIVGANSLAYDDEFVSIADGNGGPTDNDWNSYLEDWFKVVGTSDTDVGPATAVIRFYHYHDIGVIDEAEDYNDQEFEIDYAYVSIGGATVLSAGLQDSIANLDDDEAFTWVPSFISDATEGVAFDNAAGGTYETEGHSIQLVHTFDNGFKTGVALEALESEGSLVGFVSYANETLTAHLTGVAGSVLDGSISDLAVHAGFTATLEHFKIRGAAAANDTGRWNALGTAEATFDIFTLSGTVDATSEREIGAVASASVVFNETTTLKGAVRYIDSDTAIADDEGLEIRGRLEHKLTEKLTVSAEAGHIWVGAGAVNGAQSIFDGVAELSWTPSDSMTVTASAAANSLGAYKFGATFDNSFD